MDAKEFIRERNRMCRAYACGDCPLNETGCTITDLNVDELVDIVEKWSKEHPMMTNAEKFEKTFGLKIKPHGNCLKFVGVIPQNEYVAQWLDEPYVEPGEQDDSNS